MKRPGVLPPGLEVRRLLLGIPGAGPPPPGTTYVGGDGSQVWAGIPADRRWAMEVLGLRADVDLDRTDIQARFRRLVRLAHPDHGAAGQGAAERLSELAEARTVLLDVVAATSARASDRPGDSGLEEDAG
jgi:hypothetical protein